MKKKKSNSYSDSAWSVVILLIFGLVGIYSMFTGIVLIPDPAIRSSVITFLVCLLVFFVIYYLQEKSSKELYDDLKRKSEKEKREISDRYMRYSHGVKDKIKELEEENTNLRRRLIEFDSEIKPQNKILPK